MAVDFRGGLNRLVAAVDVPLKNGFLFKPFECGLSGLSKPLDTRRPGYSAHSRLSNIPPKPGEARRVEYNVWGS